MVRNACEDGQNLSPAHPRLSAPRYTAGAVPCGDASPPGASRSAALAAGVAPLYGVGGGDDARRRRRRAGRQRREGPVMAGAAAVALSVAALPAAASLPAPAAAMAEEEEASSER